MVSCCAVALCKSRNSDKSNQNGNKLSFHKFPVKNKPLCKIWINNCKRKDKINVNIERVCSDHFASDDFERDLRAELLGLPIRRKLKPNSFPSLRSLTNVEETETISDRLLRHQQRERKEIVKSLIDSCIQENEKNVTAPINLNMDTMSSKMSRSYCANCCDSFDEQPGIISKQKSFIIKEIPIESQERRKGNNTKLKIIKVQKALSSIYKFDYLDELQIIIDNVDPLSLPIDRDEDIGICGRCSDVLENLHKFYTKFNQLRQQESYIASKIVKLDDLIHRIPSLIKSNEEQVLDIKSEVEEDEDFEEMSHEDVHNSDDEFSMESEFPEDDDSKPFSSLQIEKKDVIQKQKFNVDSERVLHVRIEKLSKSQIEASTTKNANTESTEVDNRPKLGYVFKEDDDYISPMEEDEDDYVPPGEHYSSDSEFEENESEEEKERKDKIKEAQPPRHRHVVEEFPDKTCPLCQKVFITSSNFTKHILNHVVDKSKNVCPIPNCLWSHETLSRRSFLIHVRTHTQDKKHKCSVCQKTFVGFHERRYHIRSNHWKDNIYPCDHCDSIFTSKNLLQSHESTSHAYSIVCPSCPDKSFENPGSLNRHVESEHVNEDLFVCGICSHSFHLHRNLTHHMAYIHGRQIKCPGGCARRFKTQEELKDHETSGECRGGEQRFTCHICGKQMVGNRNLDFHVKRHKGEKTEHACTFDNCDRFFKTKSELKLHIQKHTGERSFVCDICGVGVYTKTSLKVHLLIHNAEKTHLCPHCGKSFLREDHLKQHLKVHSDRDEKRYPCEVCNKKFKSANSRKFHFLTQHKEAQFSCTICGAGFPYKFILVKHMKTSHQQKEDGA